jgi:hypothetical protein
MIPYPPHLAKQYPSILIAAPTYEGKHYCFEEWLLNIKRFTYPENRVKLLLADNSKTNDYALFLAKEFGIHCVWKDYGKATPFQRLAYSHEICREFAVDNKFDFLLHLETDIFPQPDIIEQLLWCSKPVVSALYAIGGGANRLPIDIYIDEGGKFDGNFMPARTTATNELSSFLKGDSLKRVFNAGLGCALIRRDILQLIPFRYEEGSEGAPDTHFAMDLLERKIPVYVNLDLMAYHEQESNWGAHVLHMDYLKNK